METYNPLDLSTQEDAEREASANSKKAQELEDQDFVWLMDNAQGRRTVWRLLNWTGVFRSSVNSDVTMMAFAEGNRNVGLRVWAQLHRLCPEKYLIMVNENNGS